MVPPSSPIRGGTVHAAPWGRLQRERNRRLGGTTLRRRSTGVLALSFFLGILVGALLSQAIGLFLEEGSTAHQLFVQYQSFGFGPFPIDLVIAEITLGFHAKANLMSVIGIFVVAQIFRWFR